MISNNSRTTNIILNAGTLVSLLIALIVGGFVAIDLYDIVTRMQVQTELNGVQINKTLNGIHETYEAIIDNQKLIIQFSDIGSQNTQTNLNLTKFNRASLIDTNNAIHEIARQHNITLPPFNASRLG